MATRILTRQQLYDRAWTTPSDNLARELGLSGRGLGKLCARYNIPVPPRGYWAKKVFGKRVSKPSLPSADTYGLKISFKVPSVTEVSDTASLEVHPLVAFEGLTDNRITVQDDLPLIDMLVLKTQKMLLRAKRDARGLNPSTVRDTPDPHVTCSPRSQPARDAGDDRHQ